MDLKGKPVLAYTRKVVLAKSEEICPYLSLQVREQLETSGCVPSCLRAGLDFPGQD